MQVAAFTKKANVKVIGRQKGTYSKLQPFTA